MASEEISFENVDDGRRMNDGWMTDAWLHYKVLFPISPLFRKKVGRSAKFFILLQLFFLLIFKGW